MRNLNEEFLSVLSDYAGTVDDRRKKFLVDTYGYSTYGSVQNMEFTTLRSLGYTGTIDDMWSKYLKDLGGVGLSAKATLLSTTFYGGLNYSVANYNPDLVFDFTEDYYRTSGSATTFDDAITHSASSNATMVDSDGLLKWRPHNLLTYSERFDSAAWAKINTASVTANSTTAPDGTLSADTINLPALNDRVTRGFSATGYQATFSVWLKGTAGEQVSITANQTDYVKVVLTGEWQFCTVSAATATWAGVYRTAVGGTDTASQVYAWGAHLYRSDLGGMVDNPDRGDSYVPTTSSAVYLPRRGHHVYNGDTWVNKGLLHESEARTNLVTYSEDFTKASWTNTATTDTASSAVGPDGLISATELIEAASTISHNIFWVGSAVAANWTASVYIKEKTAGRYLQVRPYGIGVGIAWATFDPSDGSVYESGGTNLLSATSESVGNGWYRVAITCSSALIDAGDGIQFLLTDGTLGEAANYTGDGTSGIYIYGAQLEAGSTPSSYIPTSGATVTRAAEALTVPAANLPWPSPVVIGEELFSDFAAEGEWVDNGDGSWTVTNATANTDLRIDNLTTLGKHYQYTFDITTTSSLVVYTSQSSPVFKATGSYTVNNVATSPFFIFRATAGTTATISNISVKEINPLSVSIQMSGEMTYADTGTAPEVIFVDWNSVDDIILRLDTNSSYTGRVFFRQYDGSSVDSVSADVYSPDINVPFNIASRHGSTFINGAVDGTALTANTTPVALPDLSATDLILGYDYMGTISLFRMWADDLGDAGIAEASA